MCTFGINSESVNAHEPVANLPIKRTLNFGCLI